MRRIAPRERVLGRKQATSESSRSLQNTAPQYRAVIPTWQDFEPLHLSVPKLLSSICLNHSQSSPGGLGSTTRHRVGTEMVRLLEVALRGALFSTLPN